MGDAKRADPVAGLAAVGLVAGSVLGGLVGGQIPAAAAYGSITADNCTFYGYNDVAHATNDTFPARTGNQSNADVYDRDCTGYVEVKCESNGSILTSTSASHWVSISSRFCVVLKRVSHSNSSAYSPA